MKKTSLNAWLGVYGRGKVKYPYDAAADKGSQSAT